MGQYLTKFAEKIGRRQTEQVVRLLNRRRNTGQIRTVEEFTTQLSELMREITSGEKKPTLKLFPGEQNETIHSDVYNFQLERVEDDLVAAFEEANNIDEVQRSHEAIIRDVVLKNLRAGVAELQAKIDLYEFLNDDTIGFDSAIFSTFRESKEGRTNRGTRQTRNLFTDPRSGDVVPAAQDAVIELVGERLVLATDNKVFHDIKSVRQLFDSESPQSEEIVEPPSSNLKNMIDNTRGTYWIQSHIFKNKQQYVKTKLEFDLGATREVDLIEIEPASRKGLILEAINYVDANNTVKSLSIAEQTVIGPFAVLIRKIATQKVILTFRNENPVPHQFQVQEGVTKLISQPTVFQSSKVMKAPISPAINPPTVNSISTVLSKAVPSPKVASILNLPEPPTRGVKGYQYETGIDNVRIGVADYKSRSIYLSSPLSVCGAGQLGLKVVEGRPYEAPTGGPAFYTSEAYDNDEDNEIDGTNGRNFLGSAEYYVIKQDLAPSGALTRTTTFPILPLGTNRVHQERLVLSEKSSTLLTQNDIGYINFFTTRTDGDIKVYRNGTLIPDETDTVLANGWQELSDSVKTPNEGEPMRLKIQVAGVFPGDRITVSYTPVTSSTSSVPKDITTVSSVGGLQIVDMVGDLSVRLDRGQVITLDRVGENDSNLDSRIYLAIVLRQNTSDPSLTPAVEEYTLMAGCKDISKFEDS